MLKKLQNLLDNKPESSLIPRKLIKQNQDSNMVNSSLELADALWKKGEIQQAIDLYREELQKNPQTEEIHIKLDRLIRQQQNVSEAYQKLAAAFKQQGDSDQAAEYYRQAIMIKSLISTTTNQVSSIAPVSQLNSISTLVPMDDVSNSAFSFLPLLTPVSQLAKTLPSQKVFEPLRTESASTSSKSGDFSVSDQEPDVDPSEKTNLVWEAIQIYVEQALDGYDKAQWQKTVDACQKILDIYPEMAEAYKILGNALQRMGKTGKAMKCYAQALRIQPDLAIVYAGIGKLYYQQGKWLKAKEYYQKATIINPKYREAYRNLADIWQQLDQQAKAEFYQKRADSMEGEIPLNESDNKLLADSIQTPQAIINYYKLAQTLEKSQQWKEAALNYRKAVELNSIYLDYAAKNSFKPDLPKLSANTNNTSQSQVEKAITHYLYQAEIKPSSAQIQFNLGNLYTKNQQWQEAIACYQKAIKIDSTYGQAYINFGKALAKIGKQAESLEQLYLGYTIKPELADADNLFNLGQALVAQGDRKRAVNCYSFAINLKPDFAAAYHNLADTLIQLGRKQEAIECYCKAVEHNPQDTHSYFALGEQYTANQQWDNAVEAYRRVLELQPKYPQASYRLSRALSEKLKSDLADRY